MINVKYINVHIEQYLKINFSPQQQTLDQEIHLK